MYFSEKALDPTKYNTPEYYGHTPMSFYDFEVTMRSKRIDQPSKFNEMPKK